MAIALLQEARATLNRMAPEFDDLQANLAQEARAEDGEIISHFKQRGPVGLLIPAAFGGCGASAIEALQVQIALGARSPSLAVATTMHQFSVASLVAMQQTGDGTVGLLLEGVAKNRMLVASGFAEGVAGRGILESGMRAVEVDGGVYLSGSKKPCSLSRSMDLLTASYVRESESGAELMVALIPAKSAGISSKPFWRNAALAAAESDEVVLENVFVSKKMIVSGGVRDRLEAIQIVGFLWFELLISAAYLGICTGLADRAIDNRRWSAGDRVELAMELEMAGAALRGVAGEFGGVAESADRLLGRMLLVRYGIEKLIMRISDKAMHMLGGSAFITSSETSQRLVATRGLGFHPPAAFSVLPQLDAFIAGRKFSLNPEATV